jgi:Tol biopolymer transport system component
MGFIGSLAWSPDGTRLAFSAIQDFNQETGDAEIYVMNADGSDLMDLSNNPAAEAAPDWSPDGQGIVFSSTRSGKDELFIVNADGDGLRQLTRDPNTYARDPRWSPDSSRIAFTCTRDSESSICLISPDGRGLIVLTPGVSPLWSPDGKKIAYHGSGDGKHTAIFVISTDGKNIEQVTHNDSDAFSFDWSPDGRWIAFHSNQGNAIGIYKICTLCGAANEAVRLTDDPGQMPNNPVWSPDGSQIAFSIDGELYLMNADGTGKSRLTRGVLPKSYAWQP